MFHMKQCAHVPRGTIQAKGLEAMEADSHKDPLAHLFEGGEPTEEEKRQNYIQNAINLIVKDTGYPVLSTTLTNTDLATRRELRALEHRGRIIGIDVEVPSEVLPGKFIQYRAYYTEQLIPENIKELHTED
jgi:hypothetical protein